MKKRKILSILLLIAMLSALMLPCAATEDTTDATASDTQTADNTTAEETTDSSTDSSDATGSAPAYSVQAKAALLLELSSDQVLFEQNADQQIYPASLTKIMTCLLTLEHGNLSDTVTVSETAMEGLDIAGSTAGLMVGEQLTVEELLYCMMLSSANEACNVAAEYVAGSVSAFVDMMNEKAASLGCTGTHFANPHGLHDENHYTTARDLSLIAKEALKSETFKTITSTVTHTVPATNLSEERVLYTTNLLETPGTKYYYEYAAGVKTGFTTPAGRCLISTAQKPDSNLHLLSVVCGAADVTLDNGDIENQNFTETKALFEYGFDNFEFATVQEATPVVEIPVFMSAGSDAAVLAAEESITAVMPKDYDSNQLEQDIQLTYPDGVEAPVSKGQVLGTVTVSYQGRELGTTNLVAITDTARSEIAAQASSAKSFLSEYFWILLIAVVVLIIVLYLVIGNIRRAQRRKRRRMQREQRRKSGEVIEFPGGQRRDHDGE